MKLMRKDTALDIFTAIMNYAEPEFQSIKPWGNIGDRKNDGYIKTKGIFYQVFAPEDIKKSYVPAVAKLETDFNGLLDHWHPVNEFFFVVNDKYKGVNATCENTIQQIKKEHSLRKAGFLTTKDLENQLFNLDDDQIFTIAGHIPDPAKIKQLDYSILNEVIGLFEKTLIKRHIKKVSKTFPYGKAGIDYEEFIRTILFAL